MEMSNFLVNLYYDNFPTFLSFIYIIILFVYIFVYNKQDKQSKDKQSKDNLTENDPFVICFRKTRTESLIISLVEEIQKERYIQFVVSCYYYNNEKSIKGCVYVVTSKVLYKIFFIKNKAICKEIYKFKSFVYSHNKNSYFKIFNYLENNKDLTKQSHHTEFFTWPHYYLTNNYTQQTEEIENFFKTI
jgi:hypothetical protein